MIKKLSLIILGLGFIFLAGICLVSWVSQICIEPDVYVVRGYTHPWVNMTPPFASLYVTVPGFFTSLISAAISFGHVK